MCTLGITNDLIDGGQLRAKPHLCKVKPNHILKAVLAPGWSLLVNPVVHVRSNINLSLKNQPRLSTYQCKAKEESDSSSHLQQMVHNWMKFSITSFTVCARVFF